MIKYFLNLTKNLKTTNSFNVVDEYQSSSIDLNAISWIKRFLSLEKSITMKNGSYKQHFSRNLFVLWTMDEDNKKNVIEINTNTFSLIFAAKIFILTIPDRRIKDIRFDLITGNIKKINFSKNYFIRFVDFITGKVVMGLNNFRIKDFFQKGSLSDLTKDEWDILEINTIY